MAHAAGWRRFSGTAATASALAVWPPSACCWPVSSSSITMRASPMACKRCFGSFFRQRWRRARTGFGVVAGSRFQSGSALMISASVSVTLSPLNAMVPANISKRTHPKPQMSARRSTGRPFACSGGMYAAVPMMTPACVARFGSVGELRMSELTTGPSSALARPKSSSLTVPSALTFMFAGFTSRWTMPRSCAYSRASQICFAMGSASSAGIGPARRQSASVRPSTSSITSPGLSESSNP